MDQSHPTCLITGANGYLGGCLCRCFAAGGWTPRRMVRNPAPQSGDIPFHLGGPIAPGLLAGADALVHCAYDLKAVGKKAIWEANVKGTERLFSAAREAGISKLVLISTISAFPGCKSLYGQSKLEMEALAQRYGAFIVRPGLIRDETGGGIFGRLKAQAAKTKIVPLIGNGRQKQYLVHEADLCGFVLDCCAGKIPLPSGPITVANEEPWTFRGILEALAAEQGKHPWFIPLPWRFIWAGLRFGEFLHLPLPFRSDSVVSLVNQNPRPDFSQLRQLGIHCRPYTP